MTDTETPIEAGARALHDRIYAGLGAGSWGMRTEVGRERFVGDARAVFGSVGVEGLAEEINRHAPSDAPTEPGGANCTCGDGPDAWEDIETADLHVAEAVIAWLSGGGA
jgi:hypothetical protein